MKFTKKNVSIGFGFTLAIVLFIFFTTPSPRNFFKNSYSTVVKSRNGELLIATVAEDNQWRFPIIDTIPFNFKICIIEYEDRRFYWHFGVDFLSIVRALWQNFKAGKIVSGGSTLTMQLVRMTKKPAKRSYLKKIWEIIQALSLEMKLTKEEILRYYASFAPFGRNIVGLEAAAWLYYGVSSKDLTLGQAATLAVLPNSPSLVYPGRNNEILLNKRNFLLKKLYKKNKITESQYKQALLESLPTFPKINYKIATHILNRVINDGLKGTMINSTIDYDLQARVQMSLNKYAKNIEQMKVYNVAAIVIDVETNEVLAYCGNRTDTNAYESYVDVINSPRSPGSLLKPFLYCACIQDGLITPYSLIPDIPTFFKGFHPQNFSRKYEGAVFASDALARSLNVPAVYMLRDYSVTKFVHLLASLGFTTIKKSPDFYGLSLILGAVDIKLYEIVGVYASMARALNNHVFNLEKTNYVEMPKYTKKNEKCKIKMPLKFGIAEIWYTFDAMKEVKRKDDEQMWKLFSSKQTIAWKTGTSFGKKDAWAVGITPKYVVGVWVGNATGEGVAGLTGVDLASPLLFEIFDFLPKSPWFTMPSDLMVPVEICSKSGFKAGPNCENSKVVYLPQSCLNVPTCPYHKIVNLDSTQKWQVNTDCENFSKIVSKKWFVLPPLMEYFYMQKDAQYKALPPFRNDCKQQSWHNLFEIIYPTNNSKVYIIDENKNSGKLVFQAVHKKSDAVLYWHLDDSLIGTTQTNHTLFLRPSVGKHILVVYDNFGNSKIVKFEVVNE